METIAVTLEELTDEERDRLWAESKDDDDFAEKAIAYGKLTGYLEIDRYIWPKSTVAEIAAEVMRIQAEHPERYLSREQIAAMAGRV